MHSSKPYDGKIAGLYDLEETLGSGHFAVVKLARHVFTGEKVAVKVIDKTRLDDVSRAHLFQEVRCMKLVQHPNVVRLYEVIDTQTKLYLILELGDGGDLYDYIMKHEGGLAEETAREYFRQIVRAISYCHQLHVVHRDLKPENVVFFERLGVVKLTDFGFSNKYCPGQKLETSCGSLAYCAPEILLGDSYDAPAVDVWSLGVILYMLVVGQAPFREANDSETLTMIMDCKYSVPAHVSRTCASLIARMLVREPASRATLQDITQDPWLGGGTEVESLISHQQLSEEERNVIINKMVSGGIASKDAILEALERNDYNHITATYFLLAERKLRSHRQERVRPMTAIPASASTHAFTCSPEGSKDTRVELVVPETTQGRTRKCSIVQEEEDDEEEYNSQSLAPTLTAFSRRGSRSEGKLSAVVQERIAEERRATKHDAVTLVDVKDDSCYRPNTGAGKWRGNRQRGVFEGETTSHMESAALTDTKTKTLQSMFEQRRGKLHKARTASCSSSDASDDDSESRKKRAAKLSTDSNRHHSHDDSSEGGDPGGGGGGGGAGGSTDNGGNAGGALGGGGGEQREPPPPRPQPPSGNAPPTSRPHRARRRAPDPRLRESQSLNRITEVQEPSTDLPLDRLATEAKPGRGFGARLLQSWVRRHQKTTDDEKENRCKKVKLLGRYFQIWVTVCEKISKEHCRWFARKSC